MIKKLLIICFAMGVFVTSHAQAPTIQGDTIRWNATGFTDLITQANAEGACQFVTYLGQNLDWIQSDGNYINSFTVTVSGISGSWDDLNTNGSLTLSLSANALSGTIVFTKNDLGIKADLTITGGTDQIRNSYTISIFEKL